MAKIKTVAFQMDHVSGINIAGDSTFAMALPASLPSLTTRDAVIDAVYRVVSAYDLADDALFESGLTKDLVVTGFGKESAITKIPFNQRRSYETRRK